MKYILLDYTAQKTYGPWSLQSAKTRFKRLQRENGRKILTILAAGTTEEMEASGFIPKS